MSPARRRPLNALAFAAAVCLVPLLVAGCTSNLGSSHPSPSSPPRGSNCLAGCPSLPGVSKEIHAGLIQSRKDLGSELDCDYRATSGPRVQIGFAYSGVSSAARLSRALAPLVGRENLTPISGIGRGAFEYPTSDGEICVVAIAHGYTISVLASGMAPSVVTEVAKDGVGAWKH